MTYTTEDLIKSFQKVARIREGNKDYKNDANYWTGGACNWGGSHNLKQDCETLANAFNKIGNLKDSKKELEKCASKQEFNATKSRLIRQVEESERGLENKSASSSMFNICCIWSDKATNQNVETKIKVVKENLQKIKNSLEKEQYKYYEEIKLLKLEQKKIENRMKENKRKAQSEKDPTQKALLLQMIEDDGKILEENLKKQKAIPTSNLNFDPSKMVDDLIKSMKEAIERSDKQNKNKPSGSGKRNKNANQNSSDSESDNNSDENTNSTNNGTNNQPKKEDKSDWYQENKQLILIGGATFLIIFYLYSQQNTDEYLEPNNLYNYNF